MNIILLNFQNFFAYTLILINYNINPCMKIWYFTNLYQLRFTIISFHPMNNKFLNWTKNHFFKILRIFCRLVLLLPPHYVHHPFTLPQISVHYNNIRCPFHLFYRRLNPPHIFHTHSYKAHHILIFYVSQNRPHTCFHLNLKKFPIHETNPI